jgi:hypothetical protein
VIIDASLESVSETSDSLAAVVSTFRSFAIIRDHRRTRDESMPTFAPKQTTRRHLVFLFKTTAQRASTASV